ncbi:MAG: thiol peroxidase [Chlamydiae bacterium]|nr:thiol peroxidase [Chlamydiota bacterium]
MQVKFKGSPIALSGSMPKVGEKAPDFHLIDQELKSRSLREFKGKRKLLSIVPSLDTSVCSTSAKKFNEKIAGHPEVVVLVISADLPFAQKRVCGSENIHNLTTLSMVRSKDFAKDYGVLIADGPLAGLCARTVFVLDENDKVAYLEVVPEITQEPNYDAALKALFKR